MTRETWLITGGSGYIGTHVADLFIADGKNVVLLDSLYQGLESRVNYLRKKHNQEIPLHVVDIRDYTAVENILKSQTLTGIVHTAALKAVGESVEKPDLYRKVNVDGTKLLLDQMNILGVKKIVFSSSAATYGEPESSPVSETARCKPTNPYGETKLAIERELAAAASTQKVAAVSLRYFNVAGALQTERGWLAERHDPETHLIPTALRATLDSPLRIFGRDWKTKDGTCVRDYVHIIDLIDAHMRALAYLTPSEHHVFNVGSGSGYSVAEVVASVSRVKNTPLPTVDAPRRSGDPAVLVANIDKAEMLLNWKPVRTLDQMVEDTFKAS
jgi:UDP-glucose 4-epimerase